MPISFCIVISEGQTRQHSTDHQIYSDQGSSVTEVTTKFEVSLIVLSEICMEIKGMLQHFNQEIPVTDVTTKFEVSTMVLPEICMEIKRMWQQTINGICH